MDISTLQRRIRKRVPLAPFTTFRLGGNADFFLIVKDKFELEAALAYVRELDIPYFILGKGANILIGDEGFRGMVIKNEAEYFCLQSVDCDFEFLRAESGALISDILSLCIKQGRSGFEHYAGIPSTAGGALWQNLHFLSPDRKRTVFIQEIFHHAYTFNMKTGQRNFFFNEEFKFGYDTSLLHERNQIVLEAVFQVIPTDSADLINIQKENLAWRKERHPFQYSAGSVFKKVEGAGVGKLIEQCGLKGMRFGNVWISEKHANFIVNNGKGTAKDVRSLIKTIRHEVFQRTGHQLETEIQFIGAF